MSDLNELSIAELEAQKASTEHGFGSDEIEAELERREQERARLSELLDMKLQLERADDAGLGDDPTVEAVREHVADLEAAMQPASPRSELAARSGVDEAALASLSDEEAERAQQHVDAIEMLATSSNTGARTAVTEHRKNLEALLDGHDVEAAALSAAAVPGKNEDGITADDLLEGE